MKVNFWQSGAAGVLISLFVHTLLFEMLNINLISLFSYKAYWIVWFIVGALIGSYLNEKKKKASQKIVDSEDKPATNENIEDEELAKTDLEKSDVCLDKPSGLSMSEAIIIYSILGGVGFPVLLFILQLGNISIPMITFTAVLGGVFCGVLGAKTILDERRNK